MLSCVNLWLGVHKYNRPKSNELKTPTSYDFVIFMNISSAPGSLFLSGCLHNDTNLPYDTIQKYPKCTIIAVITKNNNDNKCSSLNLLAGKGNEKPQLACMWRYDLIVIILNRVNQDDSPFSSKMLICLFDFRLTGTLAYTKGFIRVVLRWTFYELLSENKDYNDKHWRYSRLSAEHLDHHSVGYL